MGDVWDRPAQTVSDQKGHPAALKR